MIKSRILLLTILVLLFSSVWSTRADLVTLNFDSLDAGTTLRDQLQPEGIIFSADTPLSWYEMYIGRVVDVTRGDLNVLDFGGSLPNAVVFGGSMSKLTIEFVLSSGANAATDFVSFRAGDGDSPYESFRVSFFALDGTLLNSQGFTTTNGAINGGVTVSFSGNGIHSVEIQHTGGSGGAIDDLTFNKWDTSPPDINCALIPIIFDEDINEALFLIEFSVEDNYDENPLVHAAIICGEVEVPVENHDLVAFECDSENTFNFNGGILNVMGLQLLLMVVAEDAYGNVGKQTDYFSCPDEWNSLIKVSIDIKPGSDQNPINLKSKGNVPVAIITTEAFDASTVDPETVLFAKAKPVRWTLEDVDADSDQDLLLHFNTQDLNLTEDSTVIVLIGKTDDGTSIKGTDVVKIVPQK